MVAADAIKEMMCTGSNADLFSYLKGSTAAFRPEHIAWTTFKPQIPWVKSHNLLVPPMGHS